MKRIRPYILLLLCAIGLCTYAQNNYQIDSLYPVHPLDQSLMVLEDSANNLSIDQILADTSLQFQPLDKYEQPLKSGATYWATIKLSSRQTLRNWYLHLENPYITIGGWGRGNSKVDVFAYANLQQIWHKRTGTEYPKKDKDIKSLWNENRITFDLNAKDTVTIYIKVRGNGFGIPPYFNLVLRSAAYQNHDPLFNQATFFNKFLFGVLFITLLYHLLLFLYLKQKIHLWFSIWLFFSAIAVALNIDIGLINEYLLGGFPKLQLPLWIVASNAVWCTFWFFGRSFVGTKDKYPLLDKFIIGLIALILFETIVYLILLNKYDYLSYSNVNYAFRALINLSGLVLAIIMATKKDKLATYFSVGAILGNAAPIIGALWATGIVELPFDPFVLGVFMQVIAYSFGLAYRQQLKDKAFEKSQLGLLHAARARMEMQRKIDLDEIKSKFFANISHEFRTPLSLISGPLKQAIKTNEPDITISRKTYEMIRRNSERLEELIEQLLELSKIESGVIEVKLSKGGLIRYVKSIASDYENMALQKNIGYNINCPEEIPNACYDKDKLQKIIHNLLSNAFKYTPDGRSVNLVVEATTDHLVLNVGDTGPGIPADQIDKIFDRFYRIERSESKGSGIGLALTKELVLLLNGNISVESQLGKGTNFKVAIPIILELLPQAHPWDNQNQDTPYGKVFFAEPNEEEEKQDIPTVLVIEDNEDLRAYISEIISPHYKVIQAEDGLSGEQLATAHCPNIIISDVMMPKKDGYEMCKRLKSNVITSHIPIILLTAKAGQENKMSGLTQGADAYMTKPFEADELMVRIDNFIEARKRIWNQFKAVGGPLVEDLSLSSIDNQFFQKIQLEIQKNISNEQFSVEDLAKAIGLSRSQLHRKIKAILNKSANQLIRETRLNRARLILESQSMSVSETAYAVGFSNLSYFTKAFKENFGYLPSEVK